MLPGVHLVGQRLVRLILRATTDETGFYLLAYAHFGHGHGLRGIVQAANKMQRLFSCVT
jgi:hypothetical protein